MSLSEKKSKFFYPKGNGTNGEMYCFKAKDVKESIKELKEKTKHCFWRRLLYPILDEIFGKELTELEAKK